MFYQSWRHEEGIFRPDRRAAALSTLPVGLHYHAESFEKCFNHDEGNIFHLQDTICATIGKTFVKNRRLFILGIIAAVHWKIFIECLELVETYGCCLGEHFESTSSVRYGNMLHLFTYYRICEGRGVDVCAAIMVKIRY